MDLIHQRGESVGVYGALRVLSSWRSSSSTTGGDGGLSLVEASDEDEFAHISYLASASHGVHKGSFDFIEYRS